MRSLFIILLLNLNVFFIIAQEDRESEIKQMNWRADYSIELTLRNDSIYVYDVQNLHHTSASDKSQINGFTYYPVGLSEEFIDKLKKKGVELGMDTTTIDSMQQIKEVPQDKTLWSALHSYIGGGWVHFVNTLLYTMENGYVNIRSPLMQRPESNWKPKPMTESYRRTKKWKYYAPVSQKRAIKEYKIRKDEGELGNLELLPDKFIELFLNTSDREYKQMIKNNDRYKVARIDLVKLLLGANYLGSPQIKYIKHMVLKAVMQYSKNRLPSVIIFDNYNAAVALTLEQTGYNIERIIFADEDRASESILDLRRKMITEIIHNINEINKEIFRERLQQYYN